MLTICIPSRGLVHSRTMEQVLRYDIPAKLTHDLPIPDCFNWFVQNVSGDLWFVEEDMRIPESTLHKLLASDADIVTCDYPLKVGRAVQEVNGFILGGTGCTLIKRHVLDKVGDFRTDTEYSIKDFTPRKVSDEGYGRQDIDYYIRAQQAGFKVEVVGDVGHYKVRQMGEERRNVGWHLIEEL